MVVRNSCDRMNVNGRRRNFKQNESVGDSIYAQRECDKECGK